MHLSFPSSYLIHFGLRFEVFMKRLTAEEKLCPSVRCDNIVLDLNSENPVSLLTPEGLDFRGTSLPGILQTSTQAPSNRKNLS